MRGVERLNGFVSDQTGLVRIRRYVSEASTPAKAGPNWGRGVTKRAMDYLGRSNWAPAFAGVVETADVFIANLVLPRRREPRLDSRLRGRTSFGWD